MSLANSDATETYEGVGAILMSARTALGFDIDRVSNDLRIRRAYIQAIETGNFDSLPGQAYTQGFVRSYAGYLKLDADEILESLRDETRARREPDELVFPIPVPESRLPGLRVLAISLLVAGTVYVGWSLSNREQGLIERIPLVPEQFLGRKPVENPADSAKPADTLPGSSPAVETDSRSAAPAAPRIEPVSPNLTYTPPVPENTGPVAVGALPAQPKLVTPKQPAAQENNGGQGSTAAQNTAPGQAPAPAANSPASSPAPTSAAKGKVYGAAEPSRVVFKLTGDSWIRVDEADGNTLFRRFLRAGEVYNAPDRTDLTFSVGNAGAIDVSVDGESAPALGGSGELRQKLPLDADALKRGIPKSSRPGVKKAKKADAPADAKPDESGPKQDAKPDPKAEVKPETKPETKPEPKPEPKPDPASPPRE
jgi:cytoskeleton protein RodZ